MATGHSCGHGRLRLLKAEEHVEELIQGDLAVAISVHALEQPQVGLAVLGELQHQVRVLFASIDNLGLAEGPVLVDIDARKHLGSACTTHQGVTISWRTHWAAAMSHQLPALGERACQTLTQTALS